MKKGSSCSFESGSIVLHIAERQKACCPNNADAEAAQ